MTMGFESNDGVGKGNVGSCFCACAKDREMEINSMARFRYGLPIFFTYLRNENWSNVGVLVEAGVEDTK
jgi:hypothetical protein